MELRDDRCAYANSLRRFGLSAEAALRAITETPARILGIQNRVGSIQPNLDADLVILCVPVGVCGEIAGEITLTPLLIGLGIPLKRRRIAPNALYGFRTPTTLGNPRIWYEVNAATGNDMITVGGVLAAATLLPWLMGAPLAVIAAIGSAVLLLGSIAMVIHGFRIIAKLDNG